MAKTKKINSGVQVYSAISSPLCVTARSQKKRRHLFTKKREIRNLHIKKMDQDRFRFGNRFSFYSVNRVLSLRLYTTGRLWVGPNETKRSVQRRGKQGGNSRSPGGGGGYLLILFWYISNLSSIILTLHLLLSNALTKTKSLILFGGGGGAPCFLSVDVKQSLFVSEYFFCFVLYFFCCCTKRQ